MLLDLREVERLHADAARARRVGTDLIGAARLFGTVSAVSAMTAVALAWWRPSAPASPTVLALAGTAVASAVGWVLVLTGVRRWLRRGIVTDGDGRRRLAEVCGVRPDYWFPGRDWWPPVLFVVLLWSDLAAAALVLAIVHSGAPEGVEMLRWPVTGFLLFLGAILSGVVTWFCPPERDKSFNASWTPVRAVRRIAVYALPALLAAPVLVGERLGWTGAFVERHEVWAKALACIAPLWLIVAPLIHHDHSVSASSGD
ncbi:hypothetical protein ACFYWX_16580 [Streptomyces sp. NPDC002888]|uniref:hypothetical protein n=1 Tax=Streptomyces sp. NPDC002888 TaxID=3364668 RepID=UPI0036B877F1